MNGDCKESIGKLLNKQFDCWLGLPPNCSMEELAVFFNPGTPAPSSGFLGTKNIQYSTVLYRHSGFQESLRIWYRNDSVIIIDAFFPDINIGIDDFQKIVGDPDEKEDYSFNEILFSNAEWVYARKGITAYLNGDYDRVIQISVYTPLALEKYHEEIKKVLHSREFDY